MILIATVTAFLCDQQRAFGIVLGVLLIVVYLTFAMTLFLLPPKFRDPLLLQHQPMLAAFRKCLRWGFLLLNPRWSCFQPISGSVTGDATRGLLPTSLKKIGFLSFGHWTPSPQSRLRLRAPKSLLQSTRPRRSSRGARRGRGLFPGAPLARTTPIAVSAAGGLRARRPGRIEIGTAVIGMRYENPGCPGGDPARPTSHRRRAPATRHQPRLARAGDRRLAPSRSPRPRG